MKLNQILITSMMILAVLFTSCEKNEIQTGQEDEIVLSSSDLAKRHPYQFDYPDPPGEEDTEGDDANPLYPIHVISVTPGFLDVTVVIDDDTHYHHNQYGSGLKYTFKKHSTTIVEHSFEEAPNFVLPSCGTWSLVITSNNGDVTTGNFTIHNCQ